MSLFTIGEILIWLLLAAILGFILGWLIRGALRGSSTSENRHDSVDDARAHVREIAKRTSDNDELPHDDLELIHGVGPKIAELLRSMDIVSFKQVASFTKDDIATVSQALETFPDRIVRDKWVASARKLQKQVHG